MKNLPVSWNGLLLVLLPLYMSPWESSKPYNVSFPLTWLPPPSSVHMFLVLRKFLITHMYAYPRKMYIPWRSSQCYGTEGTYVSIPFMSTTTTSSNFQHLDSYYYSIVVEYPLIVPCFHISISDLIAFTHSCFQKKIVTGRPDVMIARWITNYASEYNLYPVWYRMWNDQGYRVPFVASGIQSTIDVVRTMYVPWSTTLPEMDFRYFSGPEISKNERY